MKSKIARLPLMFFIGFLFVQTVQAQTRSYMFITLNEVQGWTYDVTLFITEANGSQIRRDPMPPPQSKDQSKLYLSMFEAREKLLLEALNEYAQKGWKVLDVKAISSTSDGSTNKIITRYTLEKINEGQSAIKSED